MRTNHTPRSMRRSVAPRGRALPWLAVLLFAGQAAAAAGDAYLLFDGGNDVVVSKRIGITSRITVEAWILPDSIPATAAHARIVSKDSPFEVMVSATGSGCHMSTSGDLKWRATIGGVDRTICGGRLDTGIWQHVAGTYDGSRFRLYINGELVADKARSGSIATNTEKILVGNARTGDRGFAGGIDEVRVWSKALTASQIRTFMTGSPSPSDGALKFWYRLDEGAGQTAFDGSDNGNDGILGRSTAPDDADPARATSGGSVNRPPVVDAGTDRSVTWPDSQVALDGAAGDDGLPAGALMTAWSLQSGPGNVVFDDPSDPQTLATFSAAGTYVLVLTASDGELSVSDAVTISLGTAAIAGIVVTPAAVTLAPGEVRQFFAEGRTASGQAVPVSPAWTATGGTIDQAGRYVAGPTSGQYEVTAQSDGVGGTATVVIGTTGGSWPTGGWQVAEPDTVGMKKWKLRQARDYALLGGGSGYITRHGKLAMSWGNDETRYDIKSATKSLAGTALGLALGDHRVQIADIAQWHLPDLGLPPDGNRDTGWLGEITILQLATHTAGFEKPGGFGEIVFQPGTRWLYSDGGANWLADLLTVRFGQDLNTLMFSRVFAPLGITPADLVWRKNAYRPDLINGIKRREFGSGFRIDVDAMARIGYLYLRRGSWEGQRIIPESYVDLVSRPAPAVRGLPVASPAAFAGASDHYGVLWWTNADGEIPGVPTDAYWAWGLGDSLIVVIPSLDIVASRAGSGWRSGWSPDYSIMEPFLKPIADSIID